MTASKTNQSKTPFHISHKIYGYGRGALTAQCFATFVVSLSYVGNGVMLLAQTVIVGETLNSEYDTLSLNEEEASWFGSIPYLVQPVGTFMGILLLDFYSQRYGLLLANTIGLVFLLTLYYTSAASTALLSSIGVGLALGFTATSAMAYVSEYSQPKFRGSLSFSISFLQNTAMLVFGYIASMVNWRTLLLINAIVPLVSTILLLWLPNSPIWLLSKGRNEEAMKALMWFRGCLREEDVEEEFDDLKNYVKTSLAYNRAADAEQTTLLGTRNESNLSELLSRVRERRTLYPLFLMVVFTFVLYSAEAVGATTYAVNFLDSLNLPYDTYFLLLVILIARLAGSFICIPMLKYTGKRNLSLFALFVIALMTIGISIFIHYKDELLTHAPWIFILIICTKGFLVSQADMTPGIMAGEIFPVRTRNAGSGLNGAINSILRFFFVQTYFTTINTLGSELYFLVYGVLGMIGCVYMYFILPETEGKSLVEIEDMFLRTSDAQVSNLISK